MAFVFVAIVCHLRLLLCKMRPLSIVLLRSSYFPTFQSMLGLSIRMPVEKIFSFSFSLQRWHWYPLMSLTMIMLIWHHTKRTTTTTAVAAASTYKWAHDETWDGCSRNWCWCYRWWLYLPYTQGDHDTWQTFMVKALQICDVDGVGLMWRCSEWNVIIFNFWHHWWLWRIF